MTRNPKTPKAWANFLARAWGPRFPVEVNTIALEYSKRFDDPIATIAKADVDTFEGAIFHRPKTGKWIILYNPTIASFGRINFTLGHEFGHYLNHRAQIKDGAGSLQCSQRAVLGVDNDTARQIEREADEFASYLLMPMDDFRQQVAGHAMTLDLLRHCTDRYAVSYTAAASKWIEFTEDRAVLVVGIDGFILWSRSSDSAFRSYVFYRKGKPLPAGSVAMRPDLAVQDQGLGVELPAGVWGAEPVREITIFADRYDLTISLLVLPKRPVFSVGFEEEPAPDTLDLMNSRARSERP